MNKNSSVVCLAFLTITLLMFCSGNAFSQRLKAGPQDLSFFSTVDETDQPYAIYIPKNFDESRKYPLVVFLHGAWSNHRLGLRRSFGQGNLQGLDFIKPGNVPVETDLEATRYFPVLKDVDLIVAAPLARGTAGYQGIPEQDVYDMLADIESRFSIDENRIYLTGLSMGGGGTIWLGLTRPDIWAALAPCCPAPPDGSEDLAGNALNLPVHLLQVIRIFFIRQHLTGKQNLKPARQGSIIQNIRELDITAGNMLIRMDLSLTGFHSSQGIRILLRLNSAPNGSNTIKHIG